jgi:hypothetical protein
LNNLGISSVDSVEKVLKRDGFSLKTIETTYLLDENFYVVSTERIEWK